MLRSGSGGTWVRTRTLAVLGVPRNLGFLEAPPRRSSKPFSDYALALVRQFVIFPLPALIHFPNKALGFQQGEVLLSPWKGYVHLICEFREGLAPLLQGI